MRILHTADWHLGARLVERERLPEHAQFLDWLIALLQTESIDALLVSGDVFDAANPPQDAIALYFDFIKHLADLKTVRTVITAGNHDSASHLNAPRELLRRFNVHVFGHAGDNIVDLGEAVVAAVPFLRERDLRQTTAGETITDAQAHLRAAIQTHYTTQLTACQSLAKGRPIIAMGHLTVVGARTSESERDIHIGNLGAVAADVFTGFHYTALGHLHRPQSVAGIDTVRYSGSPIALSFSEAADTKSVTLFDTASQQIETLPIPLRRQLVRPQANRAMLEADLAAVPAESWAEVTVKMDTLEPDLDRLVRSVVAGRFEVLKVLVDLPESETPAWQNAGPTLSELQPRDVFHQLLAERKIDDPELAAVFDELLAQHESQTIA